MRVLRSVVGVLLVLTGGVWCLQGLRVLPGTFMRGSAFWAVAGAAVFLAGAWLLLPRRRGGRAGRPS